MKIRSSYIVSVSLLISVLLFPSCRKDKDASKGTFQTGILVVNEGAFGSSNGDVTYYNSSSSLVEQNIYKTINSTFPGDVLQSVTIDGDVGYLVLSNSNSIQIVDDNTFKNQGTFSDPKLINPQYLQVINGKAYISVWGAFDANFNLTNSYVLVMDLKTRSVITTIPTESGVENLVYNGQYLFASCNNFRSGSTVKVIDPTTNTVVHTFKVSAGPSDMVLDANHKLWVLTTGSNAALIRINPTTLVEEDSIAIGSYPGADLGISVDKKTLIYNAGNSVYQVAIDANVAPSTSWFDATDVVTLYSMGVDPTTGDVYLGDALNYSSAGEVYVFGANGTFKTKFAAGIDPGEFVFK